MYIYIYIYVYVCIYIYIYIGLIEEATVLMLSMPTWAIRAAKRSTPNLDSFWPIYESLYVNPKEPKGFTSGARQMNPGFTESRGWQLIPNTGLPT